MTENVIYSINGPVVTVKDTDAFSMLEMLFQLKKNLQQSKSMKRQQD